jgi:hypothetical protein
VGTAGLVRLSAIVVAFGKEAMLEDCLRGSRTPLAPGRGADGASSS